MAFGRGAKLEVVVAGDTRRLDRALTRSEARLRKFGKNVSAAGSGAGVGGGGMGILALGTRTNVAIAGAAALGLGLRSMNKAANESEVVLGQTSVAVRQAGIDWGMTAKQIADGADRISKASALDDEDVLKSFQVFVRGQKDVGKSLELAALAADVARGRYTDLESATQLVNKASMGQIGALRRAGIAIDANATSAQALNALYKAYSGSAKQYAESAAGGADKLKVAWENLQETLGSTLAPAIGDTSSSLADLVGWFDAGIKKTDEWLTKINNFGAQFGIFRRIIEQPGPPSAGLVGRPEEGTARQSIAAAAAAEAKKANKQPTLMTQLPNRLVAEAQRAELSGNTSALRAVLKKEEAVLNQALKQKGLKPGQVVALQSDLLAVASSIKSIDDQIAADAEEKKRAAEDAKQRMRDAREKAVAALKAQAQAFSDQADAIKSAVLDKFDAKVDKINNKRALDTARKALAQARQLGGPESIRLAQQGVTDAKLAIERQSIVDKTFRVSEGPKGPVNALTVGGVTININGAQDPKAIADQVLAAIRRRSKQTAGTTSGRAPNPRM